MRPYVVVDAFARVPLTGNPVAVFLDSTGLDTATMQAVAREMKLSEVTFVLPPTAGGDARVRIFTPVNELPFAGHPMLGTAMALSHVLGRGDLLLETAMGAVPCTVRPEAGTDPGAGPARVTMRQPIPVWEPYPQAPELLAALGVAGSIAPVEVYRNGPRHVFVGLATVAELSALRPDHRALAAFPDMAANCFAGEGTRWRARMFSPAYGVVEDAATGSAAGPLAIHLARHRLARFGDDLQIVQGVEIDRPALLRARARAAHDVVHEVTVGGDAVVVARGTIYV